MNGVEWVFYTVPEDHDDYQQPNVFVIPSRSSGLCLKDIRTHFPLPGDYHFRFKVYMDGIDAWMDVIEESLLSHYIVEKL